LSVDTNATVVAKHLRRTAHSCAMQGHILLFVRMPAASAQQLSTTTRYCGDICSEFTNCKTQRLSGNLSRLRVPRLDWPNSQVQSVLKDCILIPPFWTVTLIQPRYQIINTQQHRTPQSLLTCCPVFQRRQMFITC